MNPTTPSLFPHEPRLRCGDCRRWLPVAMFARDRSRPRRQRQHMCRTCRSAIALRSSTGATLDWKALKWALQLGKCAICGGDDWGGVFGVPQVDHIEVDGRKIPVGVLCAKHNLGIGYFDDQPDHLRAAANYCERTR